MEDAYVIGIRLALENGVSAGVATIRDDLIKLDRAIAASTANLRQLQAVASGTTTAALGQTQPPRPPDQKQPITAEVLPPPAPSPAPRQIADTPPQAPAAIAAPEKAALPQRVQAMHEPAEAAPRSTETLQPATATSPRPAAPPLENHLASPQLITISSQNAAPQTERAAALPSAPPMRPTSVPPPQPARQTSAPDASRSQAPAAPRPPPPAMLPILVSAPTPRETSADIPPTRTNPARETPSAPSPSPGTPASARNPSTPAAPRAPTAPFITVAARTAPVKTIAAPMPWPAQIAPSAALPPAAPKSASSSSGPTSGDVYLDGARLGHWMASNLARSAGRPPSGTTGFDPRLGVTWPGTQSGGG